MPYLKENLSGKQFPLSKTLAATTRWMIPPDISSVLNIERSSFISPWTKAEFNYCLNKDTIVGIVIEINNIVVGFLVYKIINKRIQIINMAIHPKFRRLGLGSALLRRLSKRSDNNQRLIAAEVRESNLPCQMLLKKNGYKAVSVMREYYADSKEDAYEFQYELPKV